MATNIYLGLPPPNVVKWIKDEAERKYQEMLKTPLHFTANEDNSSVSLVCYGYDESNDWNGGFIDSWCEFEYSMTGKDGDWSDYTTGQVVEINKDETVYFRAKQGNVGSNPNLNGFIKYEGELYHYFIMEGSIKANGNIQFLLENTGTKMDVPEKCYDGMFANCTALTQAPVLPAETLANYCYSSMFYKCTSLTQAPALPATTLADYCYSGMFRNCTSLTQAPALPATTLAGNCYGYMFQDCTSLTQAPELPAETLAYECYSQMFKGCTSLTQAPELPAETLASNCYYCMFANCTALTQAPELPATTLVWHCYGSMFSGCTALTQAPELPATTLRDYCYNGMFCDCTALSNVNINFTDWRSSTARWLDNVASTGTFTCPAALPDNPGVSGIPSGWTRVNK